MDACTLIQGDDSYTLSNVQATDVFTMLLYAGHIHSGITQMVECSTWSIQMLTLTVLGVTIDAQWEGWGM